MLFGEDFSLFLRANKTQHFHFFATLYFFMEKNVFEQLCFTGRITWLGREKI